MITFPHYGHYNYRGQQYVHRLHAFNAALEAKDTKPAISFYFNDDVFAKIDWSVEPNQSLKKMYQERARQLRASYDYLIFAYSGGSDCGQGLAAFLSAGVFLDEVQTYYPFKLMAKTHARFDPLHPLGILFEYELAAKPGLQELRRRSPGTLIRMIDYTDYLEQGYTEDFLVKSEGQINVQAGLYHAIKVKYIAEYNGRLAEKLKRKVGLIYGSDKPILTVADGRVYFHFVDNARAGALNQVINADHPFLEPIMFYWSPDAPFIPVKQGHAIKKAAGEDPEVRSLLEQNPGNQVRWGELVKSIIYPDWDPRVYQKAVKSDDEWVPIVYFPDRDIRGFLDAKNAHYQNKYRNMPGQYPMGSFRDAGPARTTEWTPRSNRLTLNQSRLYDLGPLQ